MTTLEWSLLVLLFLTVLFGLLGVFEAFATRKFLKQLNKQMKPLYRDDSDKQKGLVGRLGERFNKSDYGKELENTLKASNLNISPFHWMLLYILAWLVLSYLALQLLGLKFPYQFLIAYGVLKFSLKQWLKARQSKLAQSVNHQLPEVCRLFGSSIRAGLSIQQSIEMIAKEMKKPAGDLYKTMSSELKIGTPLSIVLERMNERVNSKDVHLMNHTILIQQRAGGQLSQALDHLAKTLEERERINQELKNNTTESRYIALTLSLMPVFIIMIFNMVFEGFLMPLFTLPGMILFGVVILLIGIGLLLIRQVANIKV
ncbi:type II secretion system F family protein [Ammoniphilus resinae]|uniref:Tight adherence protein B n=1 Tax=Ammoniphilus resinae TaxID=861532 RepID=A0ABS4GKE4_9BACL|nr:type II secretion system F family protein [Ammoniphilus resinae]MBP1930694.1 tight adherence protein B [Ammoniphilus resinae]